MGGLRSNTCEFFGCLGDGKVQAEQHVTTHLKNVCIENTKCCEYRGKMTKTGNAKGIIIIIIDIELLSGRYGSQIITNCNSSNSKILIFEFRFQIIKINKFLINF